LESVEFSFRKSIRGGSSCRKSSNSGCGKWQAAQKVGWFINPKLGVKATATIVKFNALSLFYDVASNMSAGK